MVKLEAEKRAIQLVYERPDPALFVACGAGVLISIATNLVSNAMKFIGDAPIRRVTISARRIRASTRSSKLSAATCSRATCTAVKAGEMWSEWRARASRETLYCRASPRAD